MVLLTAPGPRQDHPWLDIDRTTGTLYYSFTQFVDFSRMISTIQLTRSLDGGTTWSTPVALSSDTCSGSRIAVAADGAVTVIWTDLARNQVQCRRSSDQGATFGPVQVVGPFDDNINTLPPGEAAGWITNPVYPLAYTYINWPALAVDQSTGPHRGRLYASWVQRVQGTPGPITGGQGEIEPNNSPSEATPIAIGMQFAGVIPTSDLGPTDPDYFSFQGQAGQTIIITGSTFDTPSVPGQVFTNLSLFYCGPDTALIETSRVRFTGSRTPVPPFVYTLPGTGRYVLEFRGGGAYTVFYQLSMVELTRSPSSIARDMRDVVLTWSDDGGATWAPLRCVSDGPPRYNDCLPQLLVDDRGFVHVAWYDFRDEPACGALAGVYWRVSTDGGASFLPSERIASTPSTWKLGLNYATVGDHLALAARGNTIHFMWSDMRDQMATGIRMGPEIYTAHVDVDGVTATGAAVAAFGATFEASGVCLAWRVEHPEQVQSFRVHRRERGGEFVPMELVLPVPTGESVYEALDGTAAAGGDYAYRLELRLRDGSSRWSGPVPAVGHATSRLSLRAPQPNPFADRLTLVVESPRAEAAEVTVHDLRGARVATVLRGTLVAGETRLEWDGRMANGGVAPPGVYLVRATSAGRVAVHRVVRIR